MPVVLESGLNLSCRLACELQLLLLPGGFAGIGDRSVLLFVPTLLNNFICAVLSFL